MSGGFVVFEIAVRQFGPGQRPSRIHSDKSALIRGALEVNPRLYEENVREELVGLVMKLETGALLRKQVGHKPPRISKERFTSISGGREVMVGVGARVKEFACVKDLVSVGDVTDDGRHVGQSPPSRSNERLMSRRGD